MGQSQASTKAQARNQTQSQSQKRVVFDLGRERFVVCGVRGELPVHNPKMTSTVINVVTSVVESEFEGRRYLWWRGETHYGRTERFNAPVGALVRFEHSSGSGRHTYYRYVAYFIVREGARRVVELENLAAGGRPEEKLVLELENLEPVGRPDVLELEAQYRNEGYELSRSRPEDNRLAYYALKVWREASKPGDTAVVKEGVKSGKDEVISELKALAEELEEEGEEVEVSREDIYEYLKSEGLVRVRLVTFDLSTEYKGAETTYEKSEDGRVREVKVFSRDPARFRSLRRKFYDVLEGCAYRTTAGWVLFDESRLNELNKVIEELNKLSGEERSIYVIEAFMPRDYVEVELQKYIKSRELALKEIVQKLQLEKLKETERKRLQKRLQKLADTINKLKKHAQSQRQHNLLRQPTNTL